MDERTASKRFYHAVWWELSHLSCALTTVLSLLPTGGLPALAGGSHPANDDWLAAYS